MSKVWKARVAAFFRGSGGNARGAGKETDVADSLRRGPADACKVRAPGRDGVLSRAVDRGLVDWRIYRLPGSKEWWLVDHGPRSPVLYCKHWISLRGMRDAGNPAASPRAWIEVTATLYLDGEDATFS